MSEPTVGRRQRPRQPMPGFIRSALEERQLLATYRLRPAYQQNDYISWITRAKQPATQHKRLEQMLDELVRGDVYMKMSWRGKAATKKRAAGGPP